MPNLMNEVKNKPEIWIRGIWKTNFVITGNENRRNADRVFEEFYC